MAASRYPDDSHEEIPIFPKMERKDKYEGKLSSDRS